MKKLRQTKKFLYPRSVLKSLKGDDLACIKYLYRSNTREVRAKNKQFSKNLWDEE